MDKQGPHGHADTATLNEVELQQLTLASALCATWRRTSKTTAPSAWTESHTLAYQEGQARAAAMFIELLDSIREGTEPDEECATAWERIQAHQ